MSKIRFVNCTLKFYMKTCLRFTILTIVFTHTVNKSRKSYHSTFRSKIRNSQSIDCSNGNFSISHSRLELKSKSGKTTTMTFTKTYHDPGAVKDLMAHMNKTTDKKVHAIRKLKELKAGLDKRHIGDKYQPAVPAFPVMAPVPVPVLPVQVPVFPAEVPVEVPVVPIPMQVPIQASKPMKNPILKGLFGSQKPGKKYEKQSVLNQLGLPNLQDLAVYQETLSNRPKDIVWQ